MRKISVLKISGIVFWILIIIVVLAGAVIFNDGSVTVWRNSSSGGGFYVGNTSINKTHIVMDKLEVSGTNVTEAPCNYGFGGAYSYLICTDGTTVYAKNGSNGAIWKGTDTTVIQNAIGAVKGTGNPGVIIILSGVYNNATLNLSEGTLYLSIIGVGSPELKANLTQTDDIIKIACSTSGTCNGNLITGLYLNVSGNTGISGVNITNGQDNIIRDNRIKYIYSHGIAVYGNATINPSDNRIEKNYVWNPSGWVSNQGAYGIYYNNFSNDGYIEDNIVARFYSSKGGGIYVGGSHNRITGNHPWGVYQGIVLGKNGGNRVTENFLDSTGDEGIYVATTSCCNIISKNVFYQNNETSGTNNNNPAITLEQNANSNVVTENTVDNYGTSSVAWFVNETGYQNTIFGNIGRGTGGVQTSNSFSSSLTDIIIPIALPNSPNNGSMYWNGTYLCIYSGTATKKCAQFTTTV